MNLESNLEYLKNAMFEQLGGNEWKEIYRIKEEFENAMHDSTEKKDFDKIEKAIEICDKLLEEATLWKVTFYDGDAQNGGDAYFWTEEEALDEIEEMEKELNGWNSRIYDPEEVPLDEGDVPD